MLDRYLNADPAQKRIPVHANPARVAGATTVLREMPDIDTFILDDGFQHRRARRDFDLLLLNAAEPFGFGHVFPRGLLRESLDGLRRADAIVLTRCEQTTPEALADIERRVREMVADIAIYRCEHALTASIDSFIGRRYFAFAGIGHPQGFASQLTTAAGAPAGERWFPDHHHYTNADLSSLHAAAQAAGADVLVTTEKDWVKLQHLPAAREGPMPIVRAEVRIRFRDGGDEPLLQRIMGRLGHSAPAAAVSSQGAT